jgi:GH24 family phage-related lysozyme (muramidase)
MDIKELVMQSAEYPQRFLSDGELGKLSDFIKEQEGTTEYQQVRGYYDPESQTFKARQDAKGIWTIGYGSTTTSGIKVKKGDTISLSEAEDLLRHTIKEKTAQTNIEFINKYGKGLHDLSSDSKLLAIDMAYQLGPSELTNKSATLVPAFFEDDWATIDKEYIIEDAPEINVDRKLMFIQNNLDRINYFNNKSKEWEQEDNQELASADTNLNTSIQEPESSSHGVDTNFQTDLKQSESSGRYKIVNQQGYMGAYQFGEDRLTDYKDATGEDFDNETFLGDKKLQDKVFKWHTNDIKNFITEEGLDKSIGKKIKGVTVTLSGLTAVAHLGGKEGMKKFVNTNGTYNPDDNSKDKGTSLLDYLEKFSPPDKVEQSDKFKQFEEEGKKESLKKQKIIYDTMPDLVNAIQTQEIPKEKIKGFVTDAASSKLLSEIGERIHVPEFIENLGIDVEVKGKDKFAITGKGITYKQEPGEQSVSAKGYTYTQTDEQKRLEKKFGKEGGVTGSIGISKSKFGDEKTIGGQINIPTDKIFKRRRKRR